MARLAVPQRGVQCAEELTQETAEVLALVSGKSLEQSEFSLQHRVDESFHGGVPKVGEFDVDTTRRLALG